MTATDPFMISKQVTLINNQLFFYNWFFPLHYYTNVSLNGYQKPPSSKLVLNKPLTTKTCDLGVPGCTFGFPGYLWYS